MRFHILGLPHTVTTKDYNACAFTQKILKLCAMLHRGGHWVVHYGHEKSQVECTEHVTITTDALLIESYGEYDWKKQFFKYAHGDAVSNAHETNAILEVGKRKQPRDFLLCIWWQDRVAAAHPDLIVVDPGIGNIRRTWAPFNVFESYAVMHMCTNPCKWYDCVIPNYFDPEDFEYREKKDGYLLFLARMTTLKGLGIASDIARFTGMKLIVAGQGDFRQATGNDPAPNVEVVGYADVETRRKLLAGATALLQPSHYSEPFGGVVVEAMMSGTPVITSDWGAFPEIVVHGKTGFRCRTMDHFVWAARNAHTIKPQDCREWAMNFSMERVYKMYMEYFSMLEKLHQGKGFYHITEDRKELDWLVKDYPDRCPSPKMST